MEITKRHRKAVHRLIKIYQGFIDGNQEKLEKAFEDGFDGENILYKKTGFGNFCILCESVVSKHDFNNCTRCLCAVRAPKFSRAACATGAGKKSFRDLADAMTVKDFIKALRVRIKYHTANLKKADKEEGV